MIFIFNFFFKLHWKIEEKLVLSKKSLFELFSHFEDSFDNFFAFIGTIEDGS